MEHTPEALAKGMKDTDDLRDARMKHLGLQGHVIPYNPNHHRVAMGLPPYSGENVSPVDSQRKIIDLLVVQNRELRKQNVTLDAINNNIVALARLLRPAETIKTADICRVCTLGECHPEYRSQQICVCCNAGHGDQFPTHRQEDVEAKLENPGGVSCQEGPEETPGKSTP